MSERDIQTLHERIDKIDTRLRRIEIVGAFFMGVFAIGNALGVILA